MSGRSDQLKNGEAPLIDDIDLSAYLDGEAQPEDRRRIADAIEGAPGFAHQAQLLRDADTKARQYGDALLASAHPHAFVSGGWRLNGGPSVPGG